MEEGNEYRSACDMELVKYLKRYNGEEVTADESASGEI